MSYYPWVSVYTGQYASLDMAILPNVLALKHTVNGAIHVLELERRLAEPLLREALKAWGNGIIPAPHANGHARSPLPSEVGVYDRPLHAEPPCTHPPEVRKVTARGLTCIWCRAVLSTAVIDTPPVAPAVVEHPPAASLDAMLEQIRTVFTAELPPDDRETQLPAPTPTGQSESLGAYLARITGSPKTPYGVPWDAVPWEEAP